MNSKYCPNYQYSKKVSKRTVQLYLNNEKFNVKKESFASSNRNSISLRIYRVALYKIIEKTLQNSKKVSKRTVQLYLNNEKFNVKKESFASSNRNSISLRIYRVALYKIIEKNTSK